MFASAVSAQEFTTQEKSVTGVFEVPGKKKSEIFSAVNKWISVNYNSANAVTQLSDAEAGTIVIKGINSINVRTNGKVLYPNAPNNPEFYEVKFDHIIEINVKDERFRVIYKIVGIHNPTHQDQLATDVVFGALSLDGVKDENIEIYKKYVRSQNPTNKILTKENLEAYLDLAKPTMQESSESLERSMKDTMDKIYNSFKQQEKDKW